MSEFVLNYPIIKKPKNPIIIQPLGSYLLDRPLHFKSVKMRNASHKVNVFIGIEEGSLVIYIEDVEVDVPSGRSPTYDERGMPKK